VTDTHPKRPWGQMHRCKEITQGAPDPKHMLERWELANFEPEYQFVVRQYVIGKGHSVSVMWRGGEVDTIFGFEKEADALQWIKEKSQA
jgi:hypothetical protein